MLNSFPGKQKYDYMHTRSSQLNPFFATFSNSWKFRMNIWQIYAAEVN